MKVIDTGQPYRLADAVEVDAVEVGVGPGEVVVAAKGAGRLGPM